jgi:hypothetical protein
MHDRIINVGRMYFKEIHLQMMIVDISSVASRKKNTRDVT